MKPLVYFIGLFVLYQVVKPKSLKEEIQEIFKKATDKRIADLKRKESIDHIKFMVSNMNEYLFKINTNQKDLVLLKKRLLGQKIENQEDSSRINRIYNIYVEGKTLRDGEVLNNI